MSLPDEDLLFLDAYVKKTGLPTRSAALHRAIKLLRASELEAAYEAAWAEWSQGSAASWETTANDGLR